MTTLYKPVPITSAEQAEALPVGTIARHAAGPGMDHAHKVSAIGRDVWVAVGGSCTNVEMVGWSALVPIEAEEEVSKTFPDGQPYYTHTRVGGGRETWRYIVRDDEGNELADVTDEVSAWEATRKTRTRYVTTWEEA